MIPTGTAAVYDGAFCRALTCGAYMLQVAARGAGSFPLARRFARVLSAFLLFFIVLSLGLGWIAVRSVLQGADQKLPAPGGNLILGSA